MKIFSIVTFLVVLVLTFGPAAYASSNAAPANTCAVTWQPVTVPDVGDLGAVTAISATDVWMGGGGDFLHWDGANWTQFAKPENLSVTRLSASASNDVWALAGQTGQDWKHLFHWDGSTWTVVAGPATPYLDDIFAAAANDVWLVGGEQAFHWNGSEWQTYSPTESYAHWYSVVVVNGQVYIGGFEGDHVESATIFKWDGTTWSFDYSPNFGIISRMTVTPANLVWAIGYGGIAVVRNGSDSTETQLPGIYNDVAGLSAEDAYVVGNNILHWDGHDWFSNFTPAHVLRGVSAVSATDLWAVGDASTVLHGTSPCAPVGCAQQVVGKAPAYDALLPNQRVKIEWVPQYCATYYKYVVKQGDGKNAPRVARGRTHKTHVKTPALARGYAYYWRVSVCNAVGCGPWSVWYRFVVKP